MATGGQHSPRLEWLLWVTHCRKFLFLCKVPSVLFELIRPFSHDSLRGFLHSHSKSFPVHAHVIEINCLVWRLQTLIKTLLKDNVVFMRREKKWIRNTSYFLTAVERSKLKEDWETSKQKQLEMPDFRRKNYLHWLYHGFDIIHHVRFFGENKNKSTATRSGHRLTWK